MKSFREFLDKDVMTPLQIARKHNVPIVKILKSLKDGIKVEKEHTSYHDVAKHIALAHLGERSDYYDLLKKVEKD